MVDISKAFIGLIRGCKMLCFYFRWRTLFRSSIGQGINRHANYYFHIFIAILGLVFLGKTVIQTHKESYALYMYVYVYEKAIESSGSVWKF